MWIITVAKLTKTVAELSGTVAQLPTVVTQLQETHVRVDTKITNIENNQRAANYQGG